MIDIHPPQHAPMTKRDFFVHLFIVVLGILIAIGLEQSVELLHHRHQLAEIRAALSTEHQENISRYHLNVRNHLIRTANYHTNQVVLRFLLAHPGTPQNKLPAVMDWGAITIAEPVESAWLTIQHTDAASLLPPAELRAWATEYTELDREATMFHHLQTSLATCADFLEQTPDVTTLPAEDLRSTLNCEVVTHAEEAVYGDQLSVIGSLKGYGLPIDWWKMIPFFYMSQAHDFMKTNPAGAAVTKANQDAALSVLPPDQR